MEKSNSLQMDVYVNYNGNCKEAFRFYETHLGGKITQMMTHREIPDSSDLPKLPEGWSDAILHARMELGGMVLLGADIPNAEPMRSAYLTLQIETIEEAERIYKLLSADGKIFMKMGPTFFAERFAIVQDKFGTSWMILGAEMAHE